MRLRTLPLSLAGIVLGVLLAVADYHVRPWVVVLLALTTVFLQILSNLSNELGDTLHGVDADDRQGIRYSLQDGEMSVSQMKTLIGVVVGLCCLSGLAMIRVSFGTFFSLQALGFILLGAGAVWAAMHYTLGAHPYGYRGLGDLFVFLFFGVATVCGGYYLCAHEIPSWILLLPAGTVGCFSVAVLNVNNIRDMKSDARTRTTVALRLGGRRARIYQTLLLLVGWALMILYSSLRFFSLWHYLFVLTLPLFVLHLRGVWTREDAGLDPMLPLLVMSSFAFCLLGGLGYIVYLF